MLATVGRSDLRGGVVEPTGPSHPFAGARLRVPEGTKRVVGILELKGSLNFDGFPDRVPLWGICKVAIRA